MKVLKTLLGIAALSSALFSGVAIAQVYSDKPVKIIVPFPAGGLADNLARGIADELSKIGSQPVVLDFKPGANTIIAAEQVARARPDGYTLLLATDATVSYNDMLYSKLPYDPTKDFTPIVNIASPGTILVVGESFKGRTLAELIAIAKANPGKVSYDSYGLGSGPHLYSEDFAGLAGIKMNHIPFKGVADLIVAIAGGHVDIGMIGLAPAIPRVKSGKLRALVLAAPKRSPLFPDTLTFAESGFPTFEPSGWFGLVAPAGTPLAVVDKIAADVGKIITRAEFEQASITGVGLASMNLGPAKFAEFIKNDRAAYAVRIKNTNVKLD